MSKQVKHYFTQTPITQQLLITIGQTTHHITTRLTIWSAGYQVKNIQKLETEKAVKQGADFIGEFFVFSVAGALVVWEYDKSKKKELKKDQKVQSQIENVKIELQRKMNTLETKIGEMEALLQQMNDNVLEINNSNPRNGIPQNVENDRRKRKGWLW